MILFIGDSITHGHDWSLDIDFDDVLNVAVPGFTTDDIEEQISTLLNFDPQGISLLIGTNDFGNEALDRKGDDVGFRVASIIEQLHSKFPKAQILVNSILPRDARFSQRIQLANEIISKSALEQVTYIDCWPALAIGNALNPEYLLTDGFDVHLNDAGYAAWASALIPQLRTTVC